MRLSKRIYAICNQVSQGETVADIGTDHGYVPMILVRDNISPYAIMADISEGSLSKARETFEKCRIQTDEGQFRLGDGLEPLQTAEVDDIIIAGLGGHTIVEILDSDIDKSRSFKKIIMQPRKHSASLRFFLYQNGFDIISEELASEGKFVCEIITAVPSVKINRKAPFDEDDIRWAYPETLAGCDKALLKKRVHWKISSLHEEIDNLNKSNKDNADTIEKLERDIVYLQKLIADK